MDYSAKEILRLIGELSKETGASKTRAGFNSMAALVSKSSQEIANLSGDYLYRKLFLRVREANDKRIKPLRLNNTYIEGLAKFLGYASFEDFQIGNHPGKNPALVKCCGRWLSYVRANSPAGEILVAPVEIYADGKEILMRMKGRDRDFNGRVKIDGNCLYSFLESDKAKNFHLVLKVGVSVNPLVLQGVFSGISSGGDPIAGREVLVRHDELKFEDMKHKTFRIDRKNSALSEEEKVITAYFSKKENNVLRGGAASSFTLADLND